VPVVYNSGGYDAVDTLRRLAGLVDVYMPDVKFWSAASGQRYSGVPDYPDRARAALREMHAQVGDLVLDECGLAVRGLLVRHLVMPGLGDETAAIMAWLSQELSPATYVNLLGQYRPEHLVGSRDAEGRVRYPELDRRPTPEELAAARAAARVAGLTRLEGAGR
jgi:putative pyruvate formate lyase activating enzyme